MLAKIEQYIGCLVDEVLFALDGEPDQEALVKRLEALEVRWSSEWHKDLEDSFDGDLNHAPHPIFGRAILVAIEYCEERAKANRALRRTEVATHLCAPGDLPTGSLGRHHAGRARCRLGRSGRRYRPGR